MCVDFSIHDVFSIYAPLRGRQARPPASANAVSRQRMPDAGHLLLNIKNGGRDGLPSGKPLRRLRRTEDNNDILRLVNVTARARSTRAARLCRFNDNPVQLVEQTTSDPNAVGARRRHTLPGLLVRQTQLSLKCRDGQPA